LIWELLVGENPGRCPRILRGILGIFVCRGVFFGERGCSSCKIRR
jgi:hypothetical protein